MAFSHKIVFNRVTSVEKNEMLIGLQKYLTIMNGRDNVNSIRAAFVDFYFVPKKSRTKILDEDRFFELMSEKPSDAKQFAIKLIEEGVTKERMISFSSKAVHTYHDENPIYDSHVIDYLKRVRGIQMFTTDPFATYEQIVKWYETFINSKEAELWIEWFDNNFPDYQCTSRIKKIDMILYRLSIASSKGLKSLARRIGITSDSDNKESLTTICRKLAKIIYSDLLTDKEAIQLIEYFGIDSKSGPNRKRKKENNSGIEMIISKVQALY